MLLESFEHAEADFAARLLIEARNEAETRDHARPRSRCASPDFAEHRRDRARAPASTKRIEPALAGLKTVMNGRRSRGDSAVDARAERRDAAPRRGDDEPQRARGAGGQEHRRTVVERDDAGRVQSNETYAQSHLHHRRRDADRRVRARQAAVLASRQARVVPRRRHEPRRAARARLRRQLRLHDLPRHHPRRARRTSARWRTTRPIASTPPGT